MSEFRTEAARQAARLMQTNGVPWSEVVNAVRAYHKRVAVNDFGSPYPYEMFPGRYDEDDVFAAMEAMEDEGVLESGVSTRGGWINEEKWTEYCERQKDQS